MKSGARVEQHDVASRALAAASTSRIRCPRWPRRRRRAGPAAGRLGEPEVGRDARRTSAPRRRGTPTPWCSPGRARSRRARRRRAPPTRARPEPTAPARAARSARVAARPRAAGAGRAGLVSGPSRLNAVRTPSSRRVGAACFIDGWNVGAKRNAMPASRRQRSTTSGGAATCTPSASSTSALPQRLDTERLPCLATGTPHAATPAPRPTRR
jgi:hypothetical protein